MAALKPPPRMALSKWAEETIKLPESVSALPGKIRLYPFQHEIADAITDPCLRRVSLVKSVRVGLSTLLAAAVASFIANEPAPIMLLLPTQDDCRDVLVSDLEPIFAASPAISTLLEGDNREAGRDTMLSKRFPGGSLKIVAAKSPRNLRRHNVRILLIDEADAMAPSVEGDSIELAINRTLSFPDRKIVLGSTPLDADTSNVLAAYELSDKRIYEVPCPECDEFNEILWAHIKWPKDEPGKAQYCCPHCGSFIDEKHKNQMVADGRWRATAPAVKDHAGFRINTLVSPLENVSWDKLAVEFLAAKKDPDKLRQFVNTKLGEGFGESADDLDEQAIFEQRKSFGLNNIPEDMISITAGVDVQHDRLEISFLGWTADGLPKVLGHHVIWSHWESEETWHDLDSTLRQTWQHPLGGKIGIDAVCVDAGDGTTMDKVLDFTTPRARRWVMAMKGAPGSRRWITKSKAGGGQPLWIVGVDGIKTSLFDRLQSGLIEFSDDLELNWFEQLCGEREVVRYQRGRPIKQWMPISGRRNEALDCVVYAMAAKQNVKLDLDKRMGKLRAEPMVKTKPRVIESAWMNR